MILKKTLYCVFIGFSLNLSSINAQETNKNNTLINVHNTIFVTHDTTYKVSKFIDQYGSFWFRRGFADSTDIQTKMMYGLESSGKTRVLIRTYTLDPVVDTIKSYSLVRSKYENQNYIKKKHTTFLVDQLLSDVEFSYLLEKFNISHKMLNSDNYLWLLNPEASKDSKKQYSLIIIGLEKPTFNLYYYCGSSIDFTGFRITHSDSATISNKNIKKINKLSNLIRLNKPFELDCPISDTWLLINRKDEFVISHECVDSNNRSTFRDILKFYNKLNVLIKYISRKNICFYNK